MGRAQGGASASPRRRRGGRARRDGPIVLVRRSRDRVDGVPMSCPDPDLRTTSEPTKMSHSFHQCSYLSIWPKVAASTSPKTVASRRWRGRTFVGGGLSLRQTDPTHLRSIGQRLERLGRFVVRQTGKIRVRRIAHTLRWRHALKKASAACRSTPSDFEHTGSIPRRCAVVFEVAKTHRRNTGVARCAPCAGELVAASMAYRTRVKTVVAVRQTAAESR